MAETDGLTVYSDEFEAMFDRYMAISERSTEDEFRYQCGRVVHRIIRVTPPFHKSAGVSQAKKAGMNKIDRDMRRVFAPRDLVGSRKVTHLFGRTDVQELPYIVPTKEEHTDLETIWDRHKSKNQHQRYLQYRGKKFYVARKRYEKLLKKEQKKVGLLGAAYAPAATALGANLPAFMKRHAGRSTGSLTQDKGDEHLRIVITNAVPYVNAVSGLRRRVEFAVRAQKGAMERQLKYRLRQNEKLIT